ncbi:N-acetylmuramidase domain-containing protein [Chachezhania antarctica]|uniref:N-acetylmuramidase domain-containing protein n=1 Tax=Chachezhania antarctica TaxID=2340860 RepID=UPI000EB3376D|nr:N-acetylmuramidase domain-containing protein [Chachezhania antarctica]
MPIWKGTAAPMSAGAFASAAMLLNCEEAAIRALWDVESAGRGFRPDGSLTRRFEPHHMPRSLWPHIGFRPGALAPWKASYRLKTSAREEMFSKAEALDAEATYRATSWGGPQIMGFNCEAAGFDTATAMVKAMAASEGDHLSAFVTLVTSWGLASAIRAHDWQTIETRYNGGGQGGAYARKMEAAYRRHSGGVASPAVLRLGSSGPGVRRLQTALQIEADGSFGPQTDTAVRRFQSGVGLQVDGVVGQVTWAALEARTSAAPVKQATPVDRVSELVGKGAATVGTITTAAAGLQAVVPEHAYDLMIYGAIGLAVVAGGTILSRRVLT